MNASEVKLLVAGLVAVVAIVAAIFAPDHALEIFGFASVTVAALLAYVQSVQTHIAVNSRMDTLLEIATKGAAAQGRLDEQATPTPKGPPV